MSKRRRRRPTRQPSALPARRPAATPPPNASDPERQLLEAIADGELDPHLAALTHAINARLNLLHTVRSATALAQLNAGDRVRINDRARPRYLHGLHATVVELDDQAAIVCVHRPIGRFHSGEIRCPPLTLDRLLPAP